MAGWVHHATVATFPTPATSNRTGGVSRRRLSDHLLPEAFTVAYRLCLVRRRIRVHWCGAGPGVVRRLPLAAGVPVPTVPPGAAPSGPGPETSWSSAPHEHRCATPECSGCVLPRWPYMCPSHLVVPSVPECGGVWRSWLSGPATSGGSAAQTCVRCPGERGTRATHTRRASRRRGASWWDVPSA